MNKHLYLIAALTVSLIVVFGLIAARLDEPTLVQLRETFIATPTLTPTPTHTPPPTVTPAPSPDDPTATPQPTFAPLTDTHTLPFTVTEVETETVALVLTDGLTIDPSAPPTATPTDSLLAWLDSATGLTPVAVNTATPTPLPTLSIVGTLDLQQFTISEAGLIEHTPTPTPWQPTSEPRLIPVSTAATVITRSLYLTSTPPPTDTASHLWFSRPFPKLGAWGSFQYPYGTNSLGNYMWHFGIDVAAQHGNLIQAIGEGEVIHAGADTPDALLGPWPDFYGQAVVVRHTRRWEGQPVFSLYGHASEVLVSRGQQVSRSQPIARVGSTGVALGAHLHLEVRVGGNTYSHTRNPDLWIQPDVGFGVIIGRVVDADGFFVPVQLVTLRPVGEGSRYRRETYTYPNQQVNSDARYQENFTIADVPVGDYLLQTHFDEQTFTIPVRVHNRGSTFVLVTP